MQNDLTFITNEKNRKLLDRFQVLIKDTRYFDVLVGYFFTSGFHALYESLKKTDKIRILIGIVKMSREISDIWYFLQNNWQINKSTLGQRASMPFKGLFE